MTYDDTLEYRGHTFRVSYPYDDHYGAPWDEFGGHGPVSDWTTRAKRPGERILAQDRRSCRYYDVAAATQLAREDRWGVTGGRLPGETYRAYLARAVEADYAYLQGWCGGAWSYIGVVVTLADDDRGESESLWGIDSNAGDYLDEVARDLADEILRRIAVDNPDVQLSEN